MHAGGKKHVLGVINMWWRSMGGQKHMVGIRNAWVVLCKNNSTCFGSLMSLAVFELLWGHLAGFKNLKKC